MMDLKDISRAMTFIQIPRWLAATGLGMLSLVMATNAYAACESNVSFRAQSSVTYKKSGFGSSSGPKPEALAETLLRKLNIRDYFKAMLGADTLNVRKPHPRHLLETIKQIDGDPETSVLVGDTETDRRAAQNANVMSVIVTFGPEGVGIKRLKADGYLDHYDDLENVLAHLSGNN